MSHDQSSRSFEGTWERLSQVAVKGAEYDSRERQPHPKCMQGTRVDLLSHIHTLLDKREKSQLIWLHGTAGVGKSAVAFTVAERMRDLKVREDTNVEKRLAGTFFFSRKHTERCTTGNFFATLVYQLASNFPSVRSDVKRAIHDNPSLLDSNKSLRDQMEALFLQPLRKLQSRLRGCPPLTFVVDALDECTSEPELADLIIFLARALREPDIPVTHILLTSRLESHISKTFQKEEVRSLVCEIPVKVSGEGVATIISLDGADVDSDIYIFLQHSFRELESRHPDFPQPSRYQLERLASRAGRRFIVASTMMKFIDDGDNDPYGRLQLMLELTSELLPGTEVYKLYDSILSTCADPKRAYMHLSIVAALADPLPMPQLSKLLGSGLGRDVETLLMQLRSVMDIPTDSTLPVNIYHSSIRDYVSDPANCSLPQVTDIASPHSLLAHSSLGLMIKDIPGSTALLDALLELKKRGQAMEPHDPQRLKDTLAFLVRPPEPLSVLICLLWLRGNRSSDPQSWLDMQDGMAWLDTQDGMAWLDTQKGKHWLESPSRRGWWTPRHSWQTMNTRDRLKNLGIEWSDTQAPWLDTRVPGDRVHTPYGQVEWLQTLHGRAWLQSLDGRDWLRTPGARDWLRTPGGLDWLQTPDVRAWVQTPCGKEWLQTPNVGAWVREWLQIPLLKNPGGQEWLQTTDGRVWQILDVGAWVQTPGWREWLQTPGGREWLQTPGGREWLQTPGGREWLQTLDWVQPPGGREWLQTRVGREWLQTPGGQEWLQTPGGREWQSTPAASAWVTMEEFSSTLEAITKYIIIAQLPLLPALQVIQEFKSLPDFLMFAVFLALRCRHDSDSQFQRHHPIPEMDIIPAMIAFQSFANQAQKRSRSASDALKYACQNWAVHLSRAPTPWDDTLNHIFQAFWNRHLLSWLEIQWCLKGLRSCLVILFEGQKLVKPGPVHVQPIEVLPVIDPEPQQSTMRFHSPLLSESRLVQVSAPASTSEMREMSTPILIPPTEPAVAPHARVTPKPRLIQNISRCSPSTQSLALPLPPVPSPKPKTAESHASTSNKRTSDELRTDSNIPFASAAPTQSKPSNNAYIPRQARAARSSISNAVFSVDHSLSTTRSRITTSESSPERLEQ